MDSSGSDTRMPVAVKILVAGGFGVGKTTFVGSISEIEPLRTEAVITAASVGVDDIDAVQDKRTTTVAMDFGRITFGDEVILYLFGTPGQNRFWFLWDELALGSIGAVVLADTRRLADSFPALEYVERSGLPYVVAVNEFDGARRFAADEVRTALDLEPRVPLVVGDARDRGSVRKALLELVGHAIAGKRPVPA